MKKLVFMFVAMAAISFASCGGSENKGGQADSDTTAAPAVEEVASDSDSLSNDSNNVEAAPAEEAPAAEAPAAE